jgi:hypothetical protein
MLHALLDYLGPAPAGPVPPPDPAALHTPGVRALLADFLAQYRARKAAPAQDAETVKQPAGTAQGTETVKQPVETADATQCGETLKHPAGTATAQPDETVKHPTAGAARRDETLKQAPPPARLEDVPDAQLIAVLLSRRRAYQAQRLPEKDDLAAFSYQDLFYHARSRLTARGLNKRFAEDDAARLPPAPRRPKGFDVKHIPYPPNYY